MSRHPNADLIVLLAEDTSVKIWRWIEFADEWHIVGLEQLVAPAEFDANGGDAPRYVVGERPYGKPTPLNGPTKSGRG